MKKVIVLLVMAVLIGGCASKRFVKKGSQLENAGLYSDAANQYYNSLTRNVNNVDAKLGLQRTGQLVLDDYTDQFKSAYQNGTPKEAVYAFIKAENYNKKLKAVGVNPIFDEEQRAYYKEVEDTYLNDLYEKATKALGVEEFGNAEQQYAELLKFNPNFKDAKSKWKVAKYEPLYRKGNELMNAEMFRSAYITFKGIIDEVETYENSLVLMNAALQEAKLTIDVDGVYAFRPEYRGLASQFRNDIITGITNIKSPLYEVVAKTNDYSWDKKRDKINSKASISSKIQKVSVYEGKLVREEKRAYLRKVVEYVDKATNETRQKNVYEKVRYYEYQKENRASLLVEYSMKRNDTGEIVFTDSFNKQAVDGAHYCTYNGDYKKLVPGYWKYEKKDSDEDYVNDEKSKILELQSLFKENTEVQPAGELRNVLMGECVDTIIGKVEEYKPEK